MRNTVRLRCVLSACVLLLCAGTVLAVDFGTVVIRNDYGDGEVTVRLYHADALDRVFGSWKIGGNQTTTLQLDGEDITIGGDWLVDIVFGNGVTGKRHLVAKVGSHQGNQWRINATAIYKDGKD